MPEDDQINGHDERPDSANYIDCQQKVNVIDKLCTNAENIFTWLHFFFPVPD